MHGRGRFRSKECLQQGDTVPGISQPPCCPKLRVETCAWRWSTLFILFSGTAGQPPESARCAKNLSSEVEGSTSFDGDVVVILQFVVSVDAQSKPNDGDFTCGGHPEHPGKVIQQ